MIAVPRRLSYLAQMALDSPSPMPATPGVVVVFKGMRLTLMKTALNLQNLVTAATQIHVLTAVAANAANPPAQGPFQAF